MTRKKVAKVGRVVKVARVKSSFSTFSTYTTLSTFIRGFTLIEILVGLTIVTVLFGTGFASYREFARRQILNTSYGKLSSALSLARQLALSGDKPEACPTNSVLDGYRVDFGQKKFWAECAGPGGTTQARVTTIDLPSEIEILSSQPTVLYKVLGQGTDQAAEVTITVKHTGTNSAIDTILSQDGKMRLK